MVKGLISILKKSFGSKKKSAPVTASVPRKSRATCPATEMEKATVWEPSKAKTAGNRKKTSSDNRNQKKKSTQGGEKTGNGQQRRNSAKKPGNKQGNRPQGQGKQPNKQQNKVKKKPVVKWDPESFKVPEKEGAVRFHDFKLSDEIMHAVADLKFQYSTPIQGQTLAHALEGKDILGKAQTGTGKTAAFLIAAISRMTKDADNQQRKKGSPRVLIIAPTRELVIQIARDADDLGKYCDCHSMAIYGGMDYKKQQDEVKSKVVDIVAATPGRLLDFKQRRDIDLSKVEILVIDEADRMLDMGFIPDVRRIVGALPHKDRRQTMFYSATLNDTVNRLATQWTKDPVSVEIEPEQVAVDTVEQHVLLLSASDKFNVLFNILETDKPGRALIFCNRRDSSQKLTDALQMRGVDCSLLSGSVNQKVRLRTLDDFRAGKINLVIATDVAGRGIHVDGIEIVINYDIPYEPEDYVHRIGRTGRAGTKGIAYTFACEEEAFTLPDIEEYIGKPLSYKQVDKNLLKPAPKPTHKPKPRQDAVTHGSGNSRNSSGGRRPPRSSGGRRSGSSHKHRGGSHRKPTPHSSK